MNLSIDATDVPRLQDTLNEELPRLLRRERNQIGIKFWPRTGEMSTSWYGATNTDTAPLLVVKFNAKGALVFYGASDMCRKAGPNVAFDAVKLYETLRDMVIKAATLATGLTYQIIEKDR